MTNNNENNDKCNNKIDSYNECIKKNDKDSIINLLKLYDNTTTTNKYFVILYGPPASGKTHARSIAIRKVREKEKEKEKERKTELEDKELCNTFIDTGLDDITYKMCYENRNVGDKMKSITKEFTNSQRQEQEQIESLVNETGNIYINNRASDLSDLLIAFAVSLGKNIFFEVSTPQEKYIKEQIDRLVYYKYIPIIIYPFVGDVNNLYLRSKGRGEKEGRWLKCEGDYGLNKNMIRMYIEYYNIINYMKEKNIDNINYIYTKENEEEDKELEYENVSFNVKCKYNNKK